ncbi:sorting nexin-13-like isoform X2 [Achroia grisella]|uniref:sorting nexin-13-like isoform X2 n=1 Tax=Achroia grisella TaxID=688607 RepID=UPI0027D34688|nr:sorting nexin-13-like isoform X2 [Achroia grisella]
MNRLTIMIFRIAGWFGLVSVIIISLVGFGWYLTFLMFLIAFLAGIITVLYYTYDSKTQFSVSLEDIDDPLQQSNYTILLPKVIELFDKEENLPKFDNRITGSETVDRFLNEIIMIIINDYVAPWYEILTNDVEFTTHTINRLVVATGANLANRIKGVDWTHILSTRFPEEFTTHLQLFKQSRVRLKHIQLQNNKDVTNGNMRPGPKKEERRTHRRNKSDTDLSWAADVQIFGKSKFYESAENISGKTLTDLFFDLECSMENKQICRDSFCIDTEREHALLSEVSEAVLYLITPEDTWKCHALKLILIDLLSSIVLRPIMNLLSDPDNINRAIIKSCVRDSTLSSELFLLVIRSCGDAEELDATLELVQKDIQKLHSKDSAGEWEIQDRQKLSSLHYLTRIINARRATLGPQEGSITTDTDKVPEEVSRSLKFLRETTAWRSNVQYLLEIEINDDDSPYTSKAVLDNVRSSALELCDLYLAPNKPAVMGIPENCHSELVRKITMEGEEFTNNPAACFDDVQKCVCVALEDDPSWQSDFMMDSEDSADKNNSDINKDDKSDKRKYGDGLPVPGTRHNRSRSDIVGNFAQKLMNDGAGPSSLISANTSNLSLSHSEISKNAKNMMSPLSACIIETALGQEKGRMFGIYAIAVTRLSDNEVWHIYRRYSDFYDLHTSIKEKWSELGNLPFPAKKTFLNTSRSVLENRKKMLNIYLEKLSSLAQETRYMALLSEDYLGGFLSPAIQTEEKHNNAINAIVNPFKAGMRTLKNMPDQFVNTVDGVMDGISKVFQGKSDHCSDNLKSGYVSDGQEDGYESVALRLLEEVLGIRGLWLRRRLLAPLRTLISDRVNKKVLELVSSLTSPRNVVKYLKKFKQWLTQRSNVSYATRDSATKARTRVAAKVALLTAYSDELRHIAGSDTARRGLLTVFDLFQTQEINRRLILVLLEAVLTNLFPDNNIPELFKKLYSNSFRVPTPKKSVPV